jgi:hypothetical protein
MGNGKDEEKSVYEDMVLSLGDFVIRVAQKDNPTPAELSAMTELSKMLFKTL